MNPIPLRSPQGQIYGYACGLCHHVRCSTEKLGASDNGPDPDLVLASLDAATRCCTCTLCKMPNPRGDVGGEEDRTIASMYCRRCRPAAKYRMAQPTIPERVAPSLPAEVETETIRCRACGKTANCKVLCGSRWYYMALPDGWLVSDTYPPGDDGLLFVCSAECAKASED